MVARRPACRAGRDSSLPADATHQTLQADEVKLLVNLSRNGDKFLLFDPALAGEKSKRLIVLISFEQ